MIIYCLDLKKREFKEIQKIEENQSTSDSMKSEAGANRVQNGQVREFSGKKHKNRKRNKKNRNGGTNQKFDSLVSKILHN